MSSRILVIESEPSVAMLVYDLVASNGYTVEIATDGDTGLAKGSAGGFDLLVLDAALPKRSGFEVCHELRQRGVDAAILMLAARKYVADCVEGLRLGADDCVGRPLDPAEFLARLAALLRRVGKDDRIPVQSFQFGDVEVDFETTEVRKGGQPVTLAQKEIDLLRYLIDHRHRVVTRDEVLLKIWEYSSDVASRTIDVHISWLRQKLETDPQHPKYITTVRNKGYRFTSSSPGGTVHSFLRDLTKLYTAPPLVRNNCHVSIDEGHDVTRTR
jgi:two-component system, OmpR family, alkaline phosphatase synthesis response regulator PhoP